MTRTDQLAPHQFKALPKVVPPATFHMVELKTFQAFGLTYQARDVLVLILAAELGWGQAATGRTMGLSRSAVAMVINRMNTKIADDPKLDKTVTKLTSKLEAYAFSRSGT